MAQTFVGIVVLVTLSGSIGCGGSGGSDLGELDPRCESLCSDDDAECTDDIAECEQICQARVAGVEPLCSTCLLENSNAGGCVAGQVCCPDPEFPGSVLSCATTCQGSSGVNPSFDHPVCVAICSDDDPDCVDDAAQCLQECQQRIAGVSGLCATCLLERANGGACGGGTTCCPDPEFPTSAVQCEAICAQ